MDDLPADDLAADDAKAQQSQHDEQIARSEALDIIAPSLNACMTSELAAAMDDANFVDAAVAAEFA